VQVIKNRNQIKPNHKGRAGQGRAEGRAGLLILRKGSVGSCEDTQGNAMQEEAGWLVLRNWFPQCGLFLVERNADVQFQIQKDRFFCDSS
jgi:hypothetical protein